MHDTEPQLLITVLSTYKYELIQKAENAIISLLMHSFFSKIAHEMKAKQHKYSLSLFICLKIYIIN